MNALLKKEVRSYLTSMIGYVFIAFLLVICGIYFTAYQLQGAYPRFAYTLQAISFVFLIAVPVLTMRILADEQKQKTDQLLLTAPVSVTEIVLGKYFALALIFLIPVAILCFYPLILLQFGSVPLPETYTALIGFYLMGCSFLAIGLYISSLTESQVIAAVLTFLVLFVCYVIEGISSFFPETAAASFCTMLVLALILAVIIHVLIKNIVITLIFAVIAEAALSVLYFVNASIFEGLIQDILGVLDLTGHFSDFASGILDITGLVYYLSVIGIFLFLTVQSIQKRRWS
jgi:ABC-2 type transport system permease protein